MDDWDQFQQQMDLDIPENLDLNEICEYLFANSDFTISYIF